MKGIYILSIVVALVLGVGIGVWYARDSGNQRVANLQPSAQQKRQPPPQVPPRPFMTAVKWQEYRNAREQALDGDPALSAEYKSILADMQAQQKAFDSAMVAADPSVAPVLNKLEALQKSRTQPSSSPSNIPAAPRPNDTSAFGSAPSVATAAPLTPADWDEYRKARTSAFKAHPDLHANAEKLSVRMRQFQATLNAVILKADPDAAMVIGNQTASNSASHVAKPSLIPGVAH